MGFDFYGIFLVMINISQPFMELHFFFLVIPAW
jgi:hypothetical protein